MNTPLSRLCFVNCGLPGDQCACYREMQSALTHGTVDTGLVAPRSGAGRAGGDTRDTPPALYAFNPAWQGTIASHVAAHEYLSRRREIEQIERIKAGRRATLITHAVIITATLILAVLVIYADPLGIVHAPACSTEGC